MPNDAEVNEAIHMIEITIDGVVVPIATGSRKTTTNVAVSKIVGGSVGCVGGVVTIVGLALAPVTLGASAVVATLVGVSLGVAGGLTAGGAGGVGLVLHHFQRKEALKSPELANARHTLFLFAQESAVHAHNGGAHHAAVHHINVEQRIEGGLLIGTVAHVGYDVYELIHLAHMLNSLAQVAVDNGPDVVNIGIRVTNFARDGLSTAAKAGGNVAGHVMAGLGIALSAVDIGMGVHELLSKCKTTEAIMAFAAGLVQQVLVARGIRELALGEAEWPANADVDRYSFSFRNLATLVDVKMVVRFTVGGTVKQWEFRERDGLVRLLPEGAGNVHVWFLAGSFLWLWRRCTAVKRYLTPVTRHFLIKGRRSSETIAEIYGTSIYERVAVTDANIVGRAPGVATREDEPPEATTHISVSTLTGRRFYLTVAAGATVQDVKVKLTTFIGLHWSHMQIVYNGSVRGDAVPVSSLGLDGASSDLFVVLKRWGPLGIVPPAAQW